MGVVLFTAASGNNAVATLEFGPNRAACIRINWRSPESDQDIIDFESSLPEILNAIGVSIDGEVTSRRCANAEQREEEARKFFAVNNTN